MGLAWFKRRYATRNFPCPNRGLKPTATLATSLRDVTTSNLPRSVVRPALGLRSLVAIHNEDALQKVISAPCSAIVLS